MKIIELGPGVHPGILVQEPTRIVGAGWSTVVTNPLGHGIDARADLEIENLRVFGCGIDGVKQHGAYLGLSNVWIDHCAQNGIMVGPGYEALPDGKYRPIFDKRAALELDHCLIEQCGAAGHGHGMYHESGPAVVRNCILRGSAGSQWHTFCQTSAEAPPEVALAGLHAIIVDSLLVSESQFVACVIAQAPVDFLRCTIVGVESDIEAYRQARFWSCRRANMPTEGGFVAVRRGVYWPREQAEEPDQGCYPWRAEYTAEEAARRWPVAMLGTGPIHWPGEAVVPAETGKGV